MEGLSPICPYCGNFATLVGGSIVYPHRKDLYSLKFWYCNHNHEASFVGCHKTTTKPLGSLANLKLREWRKKAHKLFDPLWRDNWFKNRSAAYKWLSSKLNVNSNDCHIGMFDIKTCQRTINICKRFDGNTNNENR